jgi:hypothetical protein
MTATGHAEQDRPLFACLSRRFDLLDDGAKRMRWLLGGHAAGLDDNLSRNVNELGRAGDPLVVGSGGQPDHSRVTHSRKRTAPSGHLSSCGHQKSRRDA